VSDVGPLDAGPFGPWLEQTIAVLEGEPGAEADVPCDGCTACCESSQFVLVEPDEHDARAHIPNELLFPAPGAPDGFSVIPYGADGRCPMLRDGGCSIYEHRPRTCRAYDCRVLAAASVDVGPEKPAIRRRVDRWRFTFDGEDGSVDGSVDERSAAAVRSAARFLADHADELPRGGPPPTQRAALAVELHDLFTSSAAEPTTTEVLVALRRRHR
jgi:hypothetical protein